MLTFGTAKAIFSKKLCFINKNRLYNVQFFSVFMPDVSPLIWFAQDERASLELGQFRFLEPLHSQSLTYHLVHEYLLSQ